MPSAARYAIDLARSFAGETLSRWPGVVSRRRNGLTVFIFHSVTEHPGEFERTYNLAVTPELFLRQMEWILERYQPISPRALDDGLALPPNACLITFDDGWPGLFENAFPILEKHSVPILLFLNVAPLEGEPLWPAIAFWLETYDQRFPFWMAERDVWDKGSPALSLTPSLLEQWQRDMGNLDFEAVKNYQGRFADWRQVLEHDGHPILFYGNHLYNHWNAATLSDQELGEAFAKNQERIDPLRSGTRHFAFTFGKYLKHQPDFLIRSGARFVYTSRPCINFAELVGKVLGRVNISPWHVTSSRLHWEVTRNHVEEMLGESFYEKSRSFLKRFL